MPKNNGKPIQKIQINLNITDEQAKRFLQTLKSRFENNMQRHVNIKWVDVETKLNKNPKKLSSLYAMESTGGEPDVIGSDKKTEEIIFCDCSEQSPMRRSICYDDAGEKLRNKKGVFPAGNAVELAKAMGIELLNEEQYQNLQQLGDFDTTTSSWILTPENIRKLGGALFCDKRYGAVFTYHNGAESFYASRGFRGLLKV